MKNRFAGLMNRFGRRALAKVAPKWPVYVFHHIPKCGGSSLLLVLDSWFQVKRDYRAGWTMQYPVPIDIKTLRSSNCLCGHWELDGFHLGQRYPEVMESDKYRLLSFVRDPLDVALSLYSYEKKDGVHKGRSLEEHLRLRPNYLASIFPVTEENYKDVLGRYFYIGILEHAQESIDCLARLIGKPSVRMPVLNQSGRSKSDMEALPAKLRNEFRRNNELDYLIYEYCLGRYHEARANA